jgi:hypothetical protein
VRRFQAINLDLDVLASELDELEPLLQLFGDFVCDVAAGDSERNAYTLVEFEDATEFSIFERAGEGRALRAWSNRFEREFSQLVEWAWRLATEGATTEAFRRLFGSSNATIHFLLVIGRDADLRPSELDRLTWRSNNVFLGGHRMTCLTFDQVLASTRRRMAWSRDR